MIGTGGFYLLLCIQLVDSLDIVITYCRYFVFCVTNTKSDNGIGMTAAKVGSFCRSIFKLFNWIKCLKKIVDCSADVGHCLCQIWCRSMHIFLFKKNEEKWKKNTVYRMDINGSMPREMKNKEWTKADFHFRWWKS